MSAWGDFSTSETLLDVGISDACAVGRSGESLEAALIDGISRLLSIIGRKNDDNLNTLERETRNNIRRVVSFFFASMSTH